MERSELERGERSRTWRMKSGLALLGIGAVGVGLGVLAGARSMTDDSSAGVITGVGFGLAVLGVLTAWLSRPGEQARRLAEAGGARDRAQRDRAQMLSVVPFSMIIFGGLAVKAVGEVLNGTATFSDGMLVFCGLLYGWLGPLVVMGWDGRSLKNRKLLEDELTRHHRAQAVIPAFILLLTLMTGLIAVGLWRAELAIQLAPLAISVSGAAAALRFAWLDRKAEGET